MTQHSFRLIAVVLAVLFAAPTVMAQKFDVQGQLQKLKGEPTVRQVQEASLRYFRVNNHQVNSMRRRASWKALMPVTEISGGYTRSDLNEETMNFEKFTDKFWLRKGAGGTAYE
ncbi:MAG TPA: hypothetical protein EYN66_00325, partial [Myxococcales bacterium]|nr:hypothetical protein [Myxococcales bacterium]